MRRLLIGAAILVTAAGAAGPAQAQQSDEEAVRAVVVRLFDGMRARDTAMMRSVFAEQAQFYGLNRDGGIEVTLPADFIRSIAGAPPEMYLNEVLHDVEVRIDGRLASVWTYYDFFIGERFSHCGYDAFQLLKLNGEWKIVALADSRRTENCRQQRS